MTLEKMMKGPLMWAGLAVILVFAFGTMLWDLASDQAEQRVRGEQSTQSHIEYAEDRIDEKCLSLDPIPLRDCIHKEIESARDHARANQDLDAQHSMAFFTKIMGFTAIAGLVLGGLSIIVIIATLNEMGRANQIMRNEQRPWLDFEIVRWNLRHGWTNDGRVHPYFMPEIKVWNYGRKPAFWTTPDLKIIINDSFSFGAIDDLLEVRRETNAPVFSNTIFPTSNPVAINNIGIGLWDPMDIHISGNDLPSQHCNILFVLIYFDGEQMCHTSKLFSCPSSDLLPRPRIGTFSPLNPGGVDRYA